MKKFTFIALILAILVSCFLVGCSNEPSIYYSVTVLKSEIYEGESQNYQVKANYGFCATPISDSQESKKIYLLTFTLLNKETDNATYSLTLVYNEQNYSKDFALNPVKNALQCQIEIENFDKKEFDITIINGSESESVTLKSIVPTDTISYKQALDYLSKNQPSLVNSYTDADGNFNAEIHARIIVKDQKAYWYIGIYDTNGEIKALLIDGKTGDVLAKREVF